MLYQVPIEGLVPYCCGDGDQELGQVQESIKQTTYVANEVQGVVDFPLMCDELITQLDLDFSDYAFFKGCPREFTLEKGGLLCGQWIKSVFIGHYLML